MFPDSVAAKPEESANEKTDGEGDQSVGGMKGLAVVRHQE